MNDWYLNDEQFLAAYDAGEEINERCQLAYAYESNYTEEGEDHRWSRTNVSYCQVGDRWFEITWEEGLTENQPNECYNQPVEVKKVEYDKIIPEHTEHVVEWEKIEK